MDIPEWFVIFTEWIYQKINPKDILLDNQHFKNFRRFNEISKDTRMLSLARSDVMVLIKNRDMRGVYITYRTIIQDRTSHEFCGVMIGSKLVIEVVTCYYTSSIGGDRCDWTLYGERGEDGNLILTTNNKTWPEITTDEIKYSLMLERVW